MNPLTDRAEKAYLGTLLDAPRITSVAVTADQFARPEHAAVFDAIVEVWGSVPDRRAIRTEGGLAAIARLADVPVSYLDELRNSVPDALHGQQYEALVAQAAALRRINGIADNLANRAGSLSTEARGSVGSLGAGALYVGWRADRIQDQATAIQANSRRFDPDTMPGIAQERVPIYAEAVVERQVLAALLVQHPESRRVLEALPTAAFTDPLNREVYDAIRGLHHSARSVDPLTVDWEVTRLRGVSPEPAGVAADRGQPTYVATLALCPVSEHIMAAADYLALRHLDNGQRPAAGPSRPMIPPAAAQPGFRAPLIDLPPRAPGNGQAPEPRR